MDEVKQFLRQHGFATLVSTVEGKPWATHLPLHLSADGNTFSGHVARGNKQWKELAAQPEVLAIFQGPHTYISSSWYDHENVPTWNYMAVHVYGTVRIIEGDALIDSLRQLTNHYEQNSARPVSVDTMSKKFVEKEVLGIVGLELTISRMEAAYKLSQNRDNKNYREIMKQLRERPDEQSHQVAAAMQKLRPEIQ